MKVLYFAWMRQRVGAGEEIHNPPANVDTVAALIDWLRAKGPNYEAAFQDPRAIKVAVNQTFASLSTGITPQDEVAFFPPGNGRLTDMSVRVQEEDFDVGAEIAALREGKTSIGGICTFTGLVRDLNEGAGVGAMTLEHYPGMTEKMLREIEEEAHRRWNLDASLIVHRFGTLTAGDQIVLVITASAHRTEAFEACHFLMDWLKTKAPFWKSETLSDGSERWVEARDTDDRAVEKWS